MAKHSITMQMNLTPAYYALVDVARMIADEHGLERAEKFMLAAMDVDSPAFVVLTTEQARPALRLVHSAA